MDGMLVVAVCTKKEYMTVALPEFPFNDAAWVSKCWAKSGYVFW